MTTTNSTVLSADIIQVLEQGPTCANLAQVNAWLAQRDTDAKFWRALTREDADGLYAWALSNNRVKMSWLLSAILGLAITLVFSTYPLHSRGLDPVTALLFTLFLAALEGPLVFALLFMPMTRFWNFVFGVSRASTIEKRFDAVSSEALDVFYKQVDHHLAACQYLHDVKQRRAVCEQDLVVAAALVSRADSAAIPVAVG